SGMIASSPGSNQGGTGPLSNCRLACRKETAAAGRVSGRARAGANGRWTVIQRLENERKRSSEPAVDRQENHDMPAEAGPTKVARWKRRTRPGCLSSVVLCNFYQIVR